MIEIKTARGLVVLLGECDLVKGSVNFRDINNFRIPKQKVEEASVIVYFNDANDSHVLIPLKDRWSDDPDGSGVRVITGQRMETEVCDNEKL